MTDVLAQAYPWILSIHIISVISWMAGIFYLPRLFVHHSEKVKLCRRNPRPVLHDGKQAV